jgi:tRNA dimethylallyltransferase
MLSLEPTERAWLHERVHRRFELMLAQGFLDEMRQLRQNPLLHPELPAMRCVGYRQAWEALDHDAAAPDPAWVERAVAATRQLAKRQITWLRSMPHRQVVACDHPGVHEAVRQWAVQTLESHPGPAAMSSAPPARQV